VQGQEDSKLRTIVLAAEVCPIDGQAPLAEAAREAKRDQRHESQGEKSDEQIFGRAAHRRDAETKGRT